MRLSDNEKSRSEPALRKRFIGLFGYYEYEGEDYGNFVGGGRELPATDSGYNTICESRATCTVRYYRRLGYRTVGIYGKTNYDFAAVYIRVHLQFTLQ